MKRIITFLSACALAIATRASAAEAIYSFSPQTALVGYAIGGGGFAFSPTASLSVTSLGFGGGDLSYQNYQLSLWDSGGNVLSTAEVSTGSSFYNQSYYENIAAVTLTPGQTYYLRAAGVINGVWAGNVVDVGQTGFFSVSPQISYLGIATGLDANGSFPNSLDLATAYLIGPNFQFQVVPEPSLLALGCIGAIGVALARRRG
jgi:hypothetical protein